MSVHCNVDKTHLENSRGFTLMLSYIDWRRRTELAKYIRNMGNLVGSSSEGWGEWGVSVGEEK